MATRVLIVLPSWVGDAVMATPALRRIRAALPGAFIGALARPPIDRVLDGLTDHDGRAVFDEVHVAPRSGVLGPKHAAARIAPRRYEAALLLTNSFSTALATRIAGIPRRIGFDRDGRGILLTQRLKAPRRRDQGLPGAGYAVLPAVTAYWHLAEALLDPDRTGDLVPPALTNPTETAIDLPEGEAMALAITDRDQADGEATLRSAFGDRVPPFALLNPGGNNPAKRWPADRFAALADHLASEHWLAVAINGSPAEADLCRDIAAIATTDCAVLADHGGTIGGLKHVCAQAAIMVTNDTGPRHIAAAVGTPVVTLFGPTDPRWTTIPVRTGRDGVPLEAVLVADETLPPEEVSNDHPERCAIDRIELDRVLAAAARLIVAGPR